MFAARGGKYAGTALESQTPFVRQYLNFVGIEDIEFVYAEGLAMDEESKAAGLDQARKAIGRLLVAESPKLAA